MSSNQWITDVETIKVAH